MADQEKRIRMYDPAEVAEMFAVSEQMIYKLIDTGELGALQFGRVLRISQEDIDAYVAKARQRVQDRVARRRARLQGGDNADTDAEPEPAPEPARPTRRKASAPK